MKIERFDESKDGSLRAFSAADEYLLHFMEENASSDKSLAIYHDRFGYLSCNLSSYNPQIITLLKSQEKSILANVKANSLAEPALSHPLDELPTKVDLVLMKIPKSQDLFRLFLEHIHKNSSDEVVLQCAFMTRHFSPKLLDIASEYFEKVEQSKARKKARILSLSKKKDHQSSGLIKDLQYKKESYQQYRGVFSADHIDYASQFLLENIVLKGNEKSVLDLASGNGVFAKEISQKLPEAAFHLLDDDFLAVESAKLNIYGEKVFHYWNNSLANFEDESVDLIVCNPPFHFEYEVNIDVALALFKQAHRVLKKDENMYVVYNRSLNYKSHLKKYFSKVKAVAENDKFVVDCCTK